VCAGGGLLRLTPSFFSGVVVVALKFLKPAPGPVDARSTSGGGGGDLSFNFYDRENFIY